MPLYEVDIGSEKYHGLGSLTYRWESVVGIGTVVEVPLRNSSVLGIVIAKSKNTKTENIKSFLSCYEDLTIPKASLSVLKWMRHYYPGNSGATTKLFLPKKIYDLPKNSHDPALTTPRPSLPETTHEQKIAIDTISSSKKSISLLHGDTGTGKTRVYIEMASNNFKKGKSSIVLTPEISLSPQLVDEFSKIFPGSVIKIHSKLTRKARDLIWVKLATSNSPHIIIGPRSALFAPIKNIGLIVLDESHDDSYKQSQAPFYDARRVAAKLSITTGAKCIFGTATPDIANYHKFMSSNIPVIRMTKPISDEIVPATKTIVKRNDLDQFSKSVILSDTAIAGAKESLSNGHQILIFLNRRGTARAAVCDACGWQSSCPKCDVGLIYHGDLHKMTCHICGFWSKPPTNCGDCGSEKLSFKGFGTKSIEKEAQKIFPAAKIMRFDGDNVDSESLDQNYEAIKKGSVDIIIGTQIISKGLHLPKLNLVIVPFADGGLTLPDFTSEEKSYQLLQQVVGRVGRTSTKTKIIIQAFDDKRTFINLALNNEWIKFYRAQLDDRSKYDFPPFVYLLQISTKKKTRQGAKNSIGKLSQKILKQYPGLTILGPVPRFNEKINNTYNWQIIIKSSNRFKLAEIAKMSSSTFKANLDPTSLL